jgi:hypothetical protein
MISGCAKTGLRVAILAVPISNRTLQAGTAEPRFSVERELHPTLTPQETKPMISTSSAPGSKPALTNPELAEPRGFSFLRHCGPTLTAVLVDAAFFLKRAARIYGHQTPEAAAKQLHRIALDHLNDDHGDRVARLYRIFVYDAPPAQWRGHGPISKQAIDYGRSTRARTSGKQSAKQLSPRGE